MKIKLIIAVCLISVLAGCSHNRKKANTEVQSIEVLANVPKVEEPKVCNIIGEGIVIRTGAGENFDKLINKKATEMLNETHYCTVDYTCKVIVEDTHDGWSKIRIVSPSHLSDSHRGWIPSNVIDCEERDYSQKLDTASYEIITTQHNNAVQNFHVLIKTTFDKQSLLEFALRFKNEHCTGQCNVMIYDNLSIADLVTKYPLSDPEYLRLADHFVGMLTFDSGNSLSYYPFQDFLYKELGGKNWKVEPIK